MLAFPPCKINLGLYVTRKRNDGYHDLETCFYAVPFYDVLEMIPAEELSFASTGLHIPGDVDHNLCLKAYRLLQNDFDIQPVKIHLHKVIPTGAGLGGGSADAAYSIRLLNHTYDLNLSPSEMMSYAARLGSDCAFFINDVPMIGTGRGEILEPTDVSLKDFFLVLVNPSIHISTAEAYAGVTPRPLTRSVAEILRQPVGDWCSELTNDFENSVFQNHPEIGLIKESLYNVGARYASMSGSGSTVFGLFNSDPEIDEVNGVPVLWKGFLP